jgi:hypothetical protein
MAARSDAAAFHKQGETMSTENYRCIEPKYVRMSPAEVVMYVKVITQVDLLMPGLDNSVGGVRDQTIEIILHWFLKHGDWSTWDGSAPPDVVQIANRMSVDCNHVSSERKIRAHRISDNVYSFSDEAQLPEKGNPNDLYFVIQSRKFYLVLGDGTLERWHPRQ